MGRVAWLVTVRILIGVVIGLPWPLVPGARAAASAPGDLWLVSTRRAPGSGLTGREDRLKYWHREAEEGWVSSDLEALLASDDASVPTCVFVHGNRADRQRAVNSGWGLYRHLADEADRRFRLVIWSWPADSIPGRILKDVRAKARRSDVESYYLAWWLRRLDPQVPVSLVGYSLGARVITGALHLLAGGEVAGRHLADTPPAEARAPVRIVLVAAAVDNNWLLPRRRNALAMGRIERMLVTRNTRDPVLKWYRRLRGICGPQALGYAGPASPARLGPDREKLELLPLDHVVGRHHAWDAYLSSRPLRLRLARYALLGSLGPTVEPADSGDSGGETPMEDGATEGN